MAILIFNRSRTFAFAEWLHDAGEPLVALSERDLLQPERYARIERFESFDRDGWLDIRALELHDEYRFRRILAHSEYDLVRAARLRELIGLPGQSVRSAQAYRDKATMKELARQAGVRTAEFKRLDCALDLYRFAQWHGYPLIVKPIDGGGSRRVQVIEDAAALRAFLQAPPPSGFLAESFVRGAMYHADGIAIDGEVRFGSVSRYVNGCLAFHHGRSLGSVILEPQHAMSARVAAAVQRVIGALPPPPVMAYHAEFFHTDDDELVLCEIASRSGGARVPEAIVAAYGVNINRAWMRLQCNLPVDLDGAFARSAGWLVVPPRPGTLRALPVSIPFPWVVDYLPAVQPGATLGDAVSSVDNIALFVVVGATSAEVTERLAALDEWFGAALYVERDAS
jgi:hypothetical protein